MKTITIPVFRRPLYFAQAMNSIRRAEPRDYVLFVGIEPGCEDIRLLANSIDWIDRVIVENHKRLGVNWNNRNIIDKAMKDGSEFNVHLEEDVVISPDAFDLADWYRSRVGQEGDICMGFVSYNSDPSRPLDILRTHSFTPLGWCTTPTAWNSFFVPNWMNDKRGWDWSINESMKRCNSRSYHPALSRSNHIGREGGVHCTTAIHDKIFGNLVISQERHVGGYRICGQWNSQQGQISC